MKFLFYAMNPTKSPPEYHMSVYEVDNFHIMVDICIETILKEKIAETEEAAKLNAIHGLSEMIGTMLVFERTGKKEFLTNFIDSAKSDLTIECLIEYFDNTIVEFGKIYPETFEKINKEVDKALQVSFDKTPIPSGAWASTKVGEA